MYVEYAFDTQGIFRLAYSLCLFHVDTFHGCENSLGGHSKTLLRMCGENILKPCVNVQSFFLSIRAGSVTVIVSIVLVKFRAHYHACQLFFRILSCKATLYWGVNWPHQISIIPLSGATRSLVHRHVPSLLLANCFVAQRTWSPTATPFNLENVILYL
jgi:hypothetical protein